MWYEILLFALFLLAVIDLSVGVSNDASNFLNSAIGSKAAKFRTILIVASIGILVGSFSSEGMMEVARKGVFIPSFFTFDNIMLIFVAVMLADIVLMDFYNTIGLPTSTTVSIVFELLGASFMIGLLYSWQQGLEIELDRFINIHAAAKIILGIFVSILLAFTTGAAVQFVTRYLFTFDLERGLKKYGGIFSGLAITAITYFLLIKGLKNATIIPDNAQLWLKRHTPVIVVGSILFWSLMVTMVGKLISFNPLKFIVLAGTFSLAMAFAGNDLVNFIGVAVAGFQSFQAWRVSTLEANEFFMDILGVTTQAPLYMLVVAGVIMVLTLWSSKKARNVSQTEVNLAYQGEGEDRFKPNFLSRGIVHSFLGLSNLVSLALGPRITAQIRSRFVYERGAMNDPTASFDLLRASVNLMTASILIAYATSMKLPLSTTYVSFMVAMGTSLADGAWGKESAVYRVAGVLKVIGGWVMTALITFLISATFALIMFYGGKFGVVGLVFFAIIVLIRSYFMFKKSKALEELALEQSKSFELNQALSVQFEVHKTEIAAYLRDLDKMVSLTMRSLVGSNKDILKASARRLEEEKRQLEKQLKKAFRPNDAISSDDQIKYTQLKILAYKSILDSFNVAHRLASNSLEHLTNFGGLPRSEYLDFILDSEDEIKRFIDDVRRQTLNNRSEHSSQLGEKKNRLVEKFERALQSEVTYFSQNKVSNRLTQLQVSITLDMIQLIQEVEEVYRVHNDFVKNHLTKPSPLS